MGLAIPKTDTATFWVRFGIGIVGVIMKIDNVLNLQCAFFTPKDKSEAWEVFMPVKVHVHWSLSVFIYVWLSTLHTFCYFLINTSLHVSFPSVSLRFTFNPQLLLFCRTYGLKDLVRSMKLEI
ncbi:hypothetical protein BDZ91DRAFT_351430 [Kalaharituber pfeilii]|nr:hypothetical protein BDZ91DRAFT_351430 [Kalaharituber pfeilii]